MPGDLRDSTYSGISDRTSYARNSVASTIYGKNAVVSPVPAQTMIRGKAAVVSVKSSSGSVGGDVTPPVPSVDYGRYGANLAARSSTFSVGSTFLNSATTATQVKPNSIRTVPSNSMLGTPQVIVTDEGAAPKQNVVRDSSADTLVADTPSAEQGPFGDPASPRPKSSSSLSAVIDEAEATKKSQQEAKEREEKRGGSPFGDENEVKEWKDIFSPQWMAVPLGEPIRSGPFDLADLTDFTGPHVCNIETVEILRMAYRKAGALGGLTIYVI
jgi:hypothetical protein